MQNLLPSVPGKRPAPVVKYAYNIHCFCCARTLKQYEV